MAADKLVDIQRLKTSFYTRAGVVKAVDDVSFFINSGETLGIVGESGSGKSVTLLSLMRLIPEPPGKITADRIKFLDKDLLNISEYEMNKIRGNDISMIFQEPMTSLNPLFTIGFQIRESILFHEKVDRKTAYDKAVEMLRIVGIPRPEVRVKDYPHKLSGGMRQRVMIAMALSCNPKILLADEPTTALDVTIQAQILELMKKAKADFGMSLVLVTHDLAIIAEIAERVIVMYAGLIVEEAKVDDLFCKPLHPYTEGLLDSLPKINEKVERLHTIKGTVPSPLEINQGCRFYERCSYAEQKCCDRNPSLFQIGIDRKTRCWNYDLLLDKKDRFL